jgi:predicted amidohydrolase
MTFAGLSVDIPASPARERPRVRIALVQPRSAWGYDEEDNVAAALNLLDECAAAGVDLAVFPEGYPGPTSPTNTYDALEALCSKAAELGLYVVAGNIERASGDNYYVALHLIGDSGQIVGSYRRTTPAGPYVYQDIPAWGFSYEACSDGLPVFDTSLGKIGLLVCSEVYSPELSRIMAIKGADIILYPAGGGQGDLIPTWQTVIGARAIENIVYTGASQNLYDPADRGLGMIAGPEGVLATRADAGLIIADLDMQRLDFLRGEDEKIEVPRRYRTVPGLLRWRRPELYEDLFGSGG